MKTVTAILFFIFFASISVSSAGVIITLKNGNTLVWENYIEESNQYCALMNYGKFCILKNDIVSIKEDARKDIDKTDLKSSPLQKDKIKSESYLEISCSDLIAQLSKIFPITKKGEPIQGLDNHMGRTEDYLAQFQILAKGDKVKEASITIFAGENISQLLLLRNVLLIKGFFMCIFPNRSDIHEEALALVKKAADSPEQTVISQKYGKIIEAQFKSSLGGMTLIVRPK